MGRVAIFGDIGGQYKLFAEQLRALGADPDKGTLPDDLSVIQVGDLVHRGPDSVGVLYLVDLFLTNGQGRWTQLVGNHERQYLPDQSSSFYVREDIPRFVIEDTIESWWDAGKLKLAAAVNTTGVQVRQKGGIHVTRGAGGLLITHSGLTPGVWATLGSPSTANEAAEAINSRMGDQLDQVWNIGEMLTGSGPSKVAGVTWASPTEMYGAWAESGVLPFSQAHGHATTYNRRASAWSWPLSRWRKKEALRAEMAVDAQTGNTRVGLGQNEVIFGVDPGHGKDPAALSGPLLLTTI
jgi:hypothetical protein